ncbi:iron complex outermembrane receptor protein [Spirosoma oryzae]|uniref:Iron complex outermembrane receptor protein n=1 Tax=Spirosoma oryzae TaxID=1469603 RepID=A0A2T0SSV6_9BACT|nr:TonB-dependent receptor [Spirosoma oryzae]PRY36487.1 iron complex outermembrane receptor protein [Spirosoma oryzae]
MTNLYVGKSRQVALLAVAWLVSLSIAFSQGITGRVTDKASGSIIPGATVVVVGSTTGATTDAEGVYRLNVSPGTYNVRFSFVGYEGLTVPVTIPAGDPVTLNAAIAELSSRLNEVVVVGSRAATARTNIQTVAPVDVISTKDLKGFAQTDVSQILNFVAPSFNSNRQTVTDGTDHVDPASLRGLGPDQVLVLVNGKRRHTTALVNINGSVGRGSVGTDMNAIPVAAIERIEVLRDGAAAQYGSDAIAGVINVVLKKNYTGFTASLTAGQSFTNMKYNVPLIGGGTEPRSQSLHDGGVLQFDFSKGFRMGRNGSLTVAGQVQERGRTNRSGPDNAPTIYLGTNGTAAVFPTTPTGQNQNDFRSQLIAADQALVAQRGYNRQNMVIGNSSARNYGLFVNGTLPVGANGNLYFTAGASFREGTGYGNYRLPAIRAQQPLNADGSLYYPDGFLPAIQSKINDQSLLVGYKTKLGQWNMDLSNTFGRNSFRFDVLNSANASLPNSNTQQTDFYAGKLLFNQNTTNLDFSRLYAQVGAITGLNLAAGAEYRRDQFQIVAGELNSYVGASTSKAVPLAPYTVGGTSPGTTMALPGSQVFPGYQPTDAINASRHNVSLYADVEGELFRRLLLDLAGRYENYSDFGSKLTGKLAGRLRLIDALNIRGAISTGFRAPSLHQRYFQNTSTQFVSGNPSNTLTVNNDNPIARQVIGVNALKPETSVNYTLGLTSQLGRQFTITVDAYLIDIKDRILYSGAFSRSVLGFGTNDYVGINNVRFFANAANTRTKGIDIVATERLKAGPGQLTLTAAINFNQNKVLSINPSDVINSPANNESKGGNPDTWFRNIFFDRSQVALLETGQPQNKINLSASYTIGKFDLTLRTVRFGSVTNKTNVDPYAKNASGAYYNSQFARNESGDPYIDQTFNPIWITDLTANYRFTKAISLSLGANNLFDVYPDQIYIDPRNALGSVDYSSGRDASNRGRFLFGSNQGGFNGRFLFTRLTASF